MMTTHHVQTVLGPVAVEEVGITLPHEHLLVDLVVPYFEQPSDDPDGRRDRLVHRGDARARRSRTSTPSPTTSASTTSTPSSTELEPFTAAGGSTIVELSSVDIGRDPVGLRDISPPGRRSRGHGVRLLHRPQPTAIGPRRVQDETSPTKWSPTCAKGPEGQASARGSSARSEWTRSREQERKVLQASAEAQRQTGAAINVHVEFIMGGAAAGRWARDVLADAGADLSRVIFSHQDSSHADRAYQEELLADGIVIEYDGFGYEMATARLRGSEVSDRR